jgi:hypothetical protein
MQYGFPQHVKSKALSAVTTELPLAWDVTSYNLVPTSISEEVPSSIFRTADEFSRLHRNGQLFVCAVLIVTER